MMCFLFSIKFYDKLGSRLRRNRNARGSCNAPSDLVASLRAQGAPTIHARAYSRQSGAQAAHEPQRSEGAAQP